MRAATASRTGAACGLVLLLAAPLRAGTDAHGDVVRRGLARQVPVPTDGTGRRLPLADPAARPKGNFRLGLDARNAFDADGILADGSSTEELRVLLEDHGATLVPLAAFEAADLDGLDAVMIGEPYENAGTGYSASEIAAIHDFVTAGGRAFVLAEGGGGSDSLVGNMNSLLAPWGVQVASSATEATGHQIASFVPHAVTEGVARFGVDYQRRLVGIAAPATDLTPGTGADDALAVVDADAGRGCVFVVADQSCVHDAGSGSDYWLSSLDNALLVGNVLDWFQSAECGEITPCDAAAAVEGPAELCEGEFFELSGAASAIPTCAGPLEYRWLQDGVEAVPWGPVRLLSDFASADATYTLQVRCSSDTSCQDAVDHAVTVEPDVPPPALPNLLLAWKEADGILFRWEDTGAFGHRLRRHVEAPFPRPTSEEVVTLAGAFEHFAPGELARPPWLLFYRVFAVNCAGTEE